MIETTPSDFPVRLKQPRKSRELSPAERAGVHFTQISLNELGETKPASAAAANLARALEATIDYLMSGTTDDVAAAAGVERELVARLRQIQELPPEEKRTVLSLLDAFDAKSRIQGILG